METIPSLFESAAARFADRVAVISASEVWSYAELERRVRGLAARMLASGVRAGDRVAVLDGNTPFFLAAYFAAPVVGAVLQPLNHRLSAAELAEILRDAETRLVFAAAEFRTKVPEAEVLATELPVDDDALLDPVDVAPADLAQLYYTSGTTGRPKGVMLTHRNVCAHAACAVRELGLVADDRWGHFAPMFHLADAWASFAITSVGGVHVMAPRFSPEEALGLVERERVTITNLVPTMLTDMVASPRARDFDPSSLRMILSGGAPITPALVRRIARVFRCEYVQTYGMTETSPYLTLSVLHDHLRSLPEGERLRYAARTGRPFGAVELEVVDESGARVPADDRSVGEIRVRGETVSPGYWRQPEETAAAFKGGWLYTGDLAVVDAEGYVDIVDRKEGHDSDRRGERVLDRGRAGPRRTPSGARRGGLRRSRRALGRGRARRGRARGRGARLGAGADRLLPLAHRNLQGAAPGGLPPRPCRGPARGRSRRPACARARAEPSIRNRTPGAAVLPLARIRHELPRHLGPTGLLRRPLGPWRHFADTGILGDP